MHLHLKDVPLDVRRRAAQHLESLRSADLAEADDLTVGDTAVPVYRPDLDGIAYYEFSLVRDAHRGKTLATCGYTPASTKKARKDAAANDSDARANAGAVGFIIASADRHDFPVAHWSLDRLPPSMQVLQRGQADCHCEDDASDDPKGNPARLYKLDTLAYVAESQAGDIVGTSGQQPALISGLPHSLEKYAGRISKSTASAAGGGEEDIKSSPGEHTLERSDADTPDIKLGGDDVGWEEYKKRYPDAFGPLLDALRRRAARTWDIEDAIAEFGEGILTGTRHRVALLDEASISLRGEGARRVRATLEDNPNGPPTLVIDALNEPVQRETDLAVSIKYASGEQEELKFFLVSRDTPTNGRDDKSGPCDCED